MPTVLLNIVPVDLTIGTLSPDTDTDNLFSDGTISADEIVV